MNKQAPSSLVIDARYTLICEDDHVILIAINPSGSWQTWDVSDGRFFGPEYDTAASCYFGVLTTIEEAAEMAVACVGAKSSAPAGRDGPSSAQGPKGDRY